MKKLLLSIFSLFLCSVAFAETNINVLPMKLTADEAKSGQTGTLTVYFIDEDLDELGTFGFNLYLPSGMKTTTGIATDIFTDTKSCVWKASGYAKVSLAASVEPISKEAGVSKVACTIPYTLTADLAPGVYPVRCSSVKAVKYDATTTLSGDEYNSYSYIVVGDGGSLSFDASYKYPIPSYVTKKLNEMSEVSSLDLTNASKVYGTFACLDGREITTPAAGISVAEASYNRTVAKGSLGSLKLPFAAAGKFYTTSADEPADGTKFVHFDEVSTLPANTPAIVDGRDEAVEVAVSAKDVTLKSVAKETITSGYYLKSNNLYKVNGSAVINPYRASWDFNYDVKGFTLGDDETGISTVELDENGSIYDLNGRKLNKAGRGVNIINGQKILKK